MRLCLDWERLAEILETAARDGRHFLFEHETYRLLDRSGAESTPRALLLAGDARLDESFLVALPGDKAALKIVSPAIIHKSDLGGVAVVEKKPAKIQSARRRMLDAVPARLAELAARDPDFTPPAYRGLTGRDLTRACAADIRGVLVCEYMPPDTEALGHELLVSLRRTREFGAVLTAGLGGTDTELYAANLRPGRAVAVAAAAVTEPGDFFRLFTSTLAYRKLAGLTRNGKRVVSDHQLMECFASFLAMGRHFSQDNPNAPFILDELEINPFAISDYRMVPLDGVCRFSRPGESQKPRSWAKITRLLQPRSMAILGVSADRDNFGRVILRNVLEAGFPPKDVTVVHPKAERIEGATCVSGLAALPGKVDLCIVAVAAEAAVPACAEIIDKDLAETVMLIPGGFGETAATKDRAAGLEANIAAAHASGQGGPLFLGGNCLGVRSVPGRFDTIFIPNKKLPKRRGEYGGRSAFISQSGAFLVTRTSRLPRLDPACLVSIGNQTDLRASDFMNHFADHDDFDVIAVYMEGFRDLDGLAFVRAVRRAVENGKDVVFYKAGRTPEGKNAAAGHTASVAGDHLVCRACAEQAGAMAADNFTQFADLFLLATLFHNKTASGCRLAAMSGAGFEAVGMADAIRGDDYDSILARLAPKTEAALAAVLAEKRLSALVDVKNPMDINPAADDAAHVDIARILLADPGVDAAVVGLDPLSPAMRTLPDETGNEEIPARPDSVAALFPAMARATDKPVVAVVDAGRLYDPLTDALERGGVPVFRSCDRAVAALAKYLEGRLRAGKLRGEKKGRYISRENLL